MATRRKADFYCLDLESTADDFSVGILSFNGEILANEISMFMPETGGIHPREVARHHAEVAGKVLGEALQKAGIQPHKIKIIAFSQGSGLGPCLRTCATAARALASYLQVPLVGVNHCVAYIEISKLITGAKDPLTLYVYGGNTIVAAFEAGCCRVFGETLDIAVGNCLDVFAREAGLRQKIGALFGALVEKLAARSQNFVFLPYTVKGMDLSFSGLLTTAIELLHRGKYGLEDLCYSLQEVAFSTLAEVTERALAHTEKPELLLTGGVAANDRLQSMLETIAKEHNARFCVVPKQYALDNGAMIAGTGILAYQHGLSTLIGKSFVKLKGRLDDDYAPWVGG
ncbi:MAG: KEOPS complex N(6)-L-threonylcarbamoyladenine synthase Kae1 [Candidatus Bathyarchaeia archaeon]